MHNTGGLGLYLNVAKLALQNDVSESRRTPSAKQQNISKRVLPWRGKSRGIGRASNIRPEQASREDHRARTQQTGHTLVPDWHIWSENQMPPASKQILRSITKKVRCRDQKQADISETQRKATAETHSTYPGNGGMGRKYQNRATIQATMLAEALWSIRIMSEVIVWQKQQVGFHTWARHHMIQQYIDHWSSDHVFAPKIKLQRPNCKLAHLI